MESFRTASGCAARTLSASATTFSRVVLIAGPTPLPPPAGVEVVRVRSAAHRLKGLARLVAAPSLAAVCEGIEGSAKAGALDEVHVAEAALAREWDRVRQYLDANP